MRNYLSELSMHLLDANFSLEDVGRIMDIATALSNDFTIEEKSTSVVVYTGDRNEKAIKQFAATKLIEGRSQNSTDTYYYVLRPFFRATGKQYDEITKNDIKAYLAMKIKDGCKQGYIATIRSSIMSFYQWLVNEDLLEKNPCAAISPIKIKKEIRNPLSQTELDKLRFSCSNVKIRAIVELLLSSGARIAEATNLEITDIDFEKRKVHIRNGKGGKDRYTYISEIAAEYLKKYISTRKKGSQYILCTDQYGTKMKPDGVRFLLKKLGSAAGVENVHPHRFRRTLATTLAKRGMPIQKIQKLLGHADISVTMRYVSIDDAEVANAYEMCA